MDLMVAISAATKALEGLKLLREIDKSFDDSAFKMKIAEISSDVADLKFALTEAKTSLAEKGEEINRTPERLCVQSRKHYQCERFYIREG